MTTIMMDTRLIIIAIETPIKVPSRGPSIIIDCEPEFAIVSFESVGTKVVMAVEVVVD
jgi:hypothetical protein